MARTMRESSSRADAAGQDRGGLWVSTMSGFGGSDARAAHADSAAFVGAAPLFDRAAREAEEDAALAPGATRGVGAGRRAVEEEPDAHRTCFERDRDRILHSPAFRRLAGKTQVFIFPDDHQRTRLTHALEVAQVAGAIARALRLNVALAEAIALAHDCGHGPGGHPSEEAFSPFVPGGYDHAVFGADSTLVRLNLTTEVLDGVRNHSWSRPAPSTPEGEVVSWADRCAYCAHDLEDALVARIVSLAELPDVVAERCGVHRSQQLDAFVHDIVGTSRATGRVAMSAPMAEALAALRAFNFERIYARGDSVRQGDKVRRMLTALVEHFVAHPVADFGGEDDPVGAAVAYVSGMTDRFACARAVELVEWPIAELPRGFDL